MAQTTAKRRHPMSQKRRKRRLVISTSSVIILLIILVILIFGGGKDKNPKPVNTAKPANNVSAIPTPTTAPTPTPTPTTKPVSSGPLICIDPGHGYSDGGSVSDYLSAHNMTEKDINLPVALKVRDILVQKGYNIIMTHDSDVIPEGVDTDKDGFYIVQTENIAKFANDKKADYFFSIHCDSYPADESVCGPRFYYYDKGAGNPKDWVTTIAKGFKESTGIDPKVVELTDKNYIQNILKLAHNTAGYVELGYISNKEEEEKLITDEYQTKLAEGIAKGIMDCIHLN